VRRVMFLGCQFLVIGVDIQNFLLKREPASSGRSGGFYSWSISSSVFLLVPT
jgi:hypothetical protein